MLRNRLLMTVLAGPSDTTAPTCTITSAASGTTAGAFTATFTFSEDVTGFALGDITVSANAGAGTFNAVSGSVYTAVITPTATGTVTVDVAAGVSTDAAGNANTAAVQFSIRYFSTIVYVRKTGNDTTGDGSTGTPWLTVQKAIASVAIGGGGAIIVGDGTYNEVTGANNYFQIARRFTGLQYIIPESGVYGSVVLRGNGDATYNIWLNTAQNLRFENLDLTPVSGASRAVLFLRSGGTTVENLEFYQCNIPGMVEVNTASGLSYTGLLFDGCTIAQGAAGNYALQLGQDGVAIGTIAGIVRNCTVSGNNHVVLMGGDCAGMVAQDNTINAGSGAYGVVLKECDGNTVSGNSITGGSVAGIYCKGAKNATITGNAITAAQANLMQIIVNSATGNKCQNITFTGNTLTASGTAKLLSWGNSDNDLGGGVCDYNTYVVGVNKYGLVRADTDVQSLAELQAAWTGYDVAGNDTHSTGA